VLLPAALLSQQFLFLIVVPIGLIVGLRNLNYAIKPVSTRDEWRREHLTSQLTAGITLHTALLVFGTSRTLGLQLTGMASLWPWMIPALVGVPVIVWMRGGRSEGPEGPEGPAGSKGPEGPKGPESPKGPEGSRGREGLLGPQEPAGSVRRRGV